MSKKLRRRTFSVVGGLACLAGLALPLALPPAAAAAENYNVILFLTDDLGIEYLDFYPVGDPGATAPTPELSARVSDWLRIDNAWSAPVCSPTRTSLMTGLYGFTSGIGSLIRTNPNSNPDDLDLTRDDFLPKLLDDSVDDLGDPVDYETSAYGKWHLGEAFFDANSTPPIIAGFDHYRGQLYNPQFGVFEFSQLYYNFMRTIDDDDNSPPTETPVNGYYTTRDHIDGVIEWLTDLEEQDPQPSWFAYVPFFAPHAPFLCPPSSLYPQITCDAQDNAEDIYEDMIEAVDVEIGNVLAWLEDSDFKDNTVVIFASDNGVPTEVARSPWNPNRVKGSVFEGGVRVPLLIGDLRDSGDERIVDPGVLPIEEAIVNLADIYDTVLELTNTPGPSRPAWEDAQSQSLVPYFKEPRSGPIRDCIYTEHFQPNFRQGEAPPVLSPNDRTVAGGTDTSGGVIYKLLRMSGTKALYDLENDPFETTNLLNPNNCQSGACYNEQRIASELLACADQFSEVCFRRGEGDNCTYNSDCCPGLFCDLASAGASCQPFVP